MPDEGQPTRESPWPVALTRDSLRGSTRLARWSRSRSRRVVPRRPKQTSSRVGALTPRHRQALGSRVSSRAAPLVPLNSVRERGSASERSRHAERCNRASLSANLALWGLGITQLPITYPSFIGVNATSICKMQSHSSTTALPPPNVLRNLILHVSNSSPNSAASRPSNSWCTAPKRRRAESHHASAAISRHSCRCRRRSSSRERRFRIGGCSSLSWHVQVLRRFESSPSGPPGEFCRPARTELVLATSSSWSSSWLAGRLFGFVSTVAASTGRVAIAAVAVPLSPRIASGKDVAPDPEAVVGVVEGGGGGTPLPAVSAARKCSSN